MGSLLNAEVIGNAGADAVLNTTDAGDMVTSFNVAVNKAGPKRDETQWVRVTVWGKQAKFFADNIKKGTLVYVAGRTYLRPYEKDGVQRVSWEVSSTECQLLSRSEAAALSSDEEEEILF